jgi:hypothetical protein
MSWRGSYSLRFSRIVFLFCLGALPGGTALAAEEIPIERCDRLPVITVSVQGKSLRFLVDTAAMSVLNIKSFAGGQMTAIPVTSFTGTSLTSARQVTLPELVLGGYRLYNLRLPAIDLSPIVEACGGQIDGILGLDLLEEMGATLDLKNRVALLESPDDESEETLQEEFLEGHRICMDAFNSGDRDSVVNCLDPQVALFTASNEIRGREEVIDYLQHRYFKTAPPARFELEVSDSRFLGDAVWFGYDLTISMPEGTIKAKGMAICRRSQGRWRLLNMHNSFEVKS